MTDHYRRPPSTKRIKAVIAALGYEIVWHDDEAAGYTYFDERLISLRRGMTNNEVRSTLAHEAMHAMFGPFPADQEDEEERLVEWLASRWLIPLSVLRTVAKRRLEPHQALTYARVDPAALQARVRRAMADDQRADWTQNLQQLADLPA